MVQPRPGSDMATSTDVIISATAKALVALEAEEDQLRARQLVLVNEQYQIFLKLEALKTTKEQLWKATHLP